MAPEVEGRNKTVSVMNKKLMTGSYILIPHGNKDSGLFCACSTQLEEAKFICSTTGPFSYPISILQHAFPLL